MYSLERCNWKLSECETLCRYYKTDDIFFNITVNYHHLGVARSYLNIDNGH